MLNKTGDSWHPYLVHDLKKCFKHFTFEGDGSYVFVIYDLYYLKECYLSMPTFWIFF